MIIFCCLVIAFATGFLCGIKWFERNLKKYADKNIEKLVRERVDLYLKKNKKAPL